MEDTEYNDDFATFQPKPKIKDPLDAQDKITRSKMEKTRSREPEAILSINLDFS